MKLVTIFVSFLVIKSIHGCNRDKSPLTNGITKPPGERNWNKWDIPPDNEDWEGFVNLLGTRENAMDTSIPKKTSNTLDESSMKNAPGFPQRWLSVGPGFSGLYPPSKAKVVGYVGQSAYCLDPPDRGTGTKFWYLRWYYDHRKGRCRRFVYSGYGGNANRFIDERNCLKNCRDPPSICCVSETMIDFEKFLDPAARRRLLKRRYKRGSKKNHD